MLTGSARATEWGEDRGRGRSADQGLNSIGTESLERQVIAVKAERGKNRCRHTSGHAGFLTGSNIPSAPAPYAISILGI